MAEPSLPEESLFAQVLELESAAERAAFLDRACAGNPALRAGVEALLHADARSGDLLDLPDQPAATVEYRGESPGTVIGPYKLLETIGEGAFGTVFLAEQSATIRRKVALKVLKPGMDTRQVVARFEAERQALAIMDHPNIARVFDGGVTHSGRPYFVMELVKGTPITEFCDQHRLSPQQRLELFVQVCQAVQHAHQKGIIHRDIKPSNVLVSRHDTTPVVKVIDFGVAKALGQELTDKTLFTGLAQMIGTPLYMSPEQAGMSDLDIDTRSDVYSLGVLLYELLTGTTPFPRERFKAAGYDEIRRIIREEEPPKPSTRLSTVAELPTIAANRRVESRRLSRQVRGELDWVVMKALEKDRNRRYETANSFAADVRRYLADEPVLACPPSTAYRLRKFARRNRGPVLAVSVLGLALTGAIVGTTWALVRAESARLSEAGQRAAAERERDEKERARAAAVEARQRAEDERGTADAIKAFVTSDLLGMTNGWRGTGGGDERGPDVTVRALLDRAARRAGEQFVGRPLVEAGVRMAVGGSYGAIGLHREALPQLERALELYRRHRGPDAFDTLNAIRAVAVQYQWYAHDPIRSEPLAREALEGFSRTRGPDARDTIDMMGILAEVVGPRGLGRRDEGDRLKAEAYERSLRILGPNNVVTANLRGDVIEILIDRRDYPAAEQQATEALARNREAAGEAHPVTHNAARNLAKIYRLTKRPDQAERLAAEWLAVARRVFGEQGNETLWTATELANVYQARGKKAEEVALRERIYVGRQRGHGPTNRNTVRAAVELVESYTRLGRPDEARRVLDEAAAAAAGAGWRDDTPALKVRVRLGQAYRTTGRPAEAVTVLDDVLRRAGEVEATREARWDAFHSRAWANHDLARHADAAADWGRAAAEPGPRRAEFARLRAGALARSGDVEAAVREADAVADLGDGYARYKLAGVYSLAAGRADAADAAEGHARRAVGLLREAVAGGWVDTFTVVNDPDLAAILARQDFREVLTEMGSKSSLRYPDALAYLGAKLLDWGAFAAAEPVLRDCLALRDKMQPEAWNTFNIRSMLGGSLRGQGAHAEAEPLLLAGYEGMKTRSKAIPPFARDRLAEAADRLVELYEALRKPDEVARWRAERATYPFVAPPPREVKK